MVAHIFSSFFSSLKATKLTKMFAIILTFASICCGIWTYFAITQSENPFGSDPIEVVILILIDATLLLALIAIIARRILRLWLERKKGSVGSRLQTRIIVLFSLVAIIPTLIVAIFSATYFNYGIQSWFDSRIQVALDASDTVVKAYLEEHKKTIVGDILGMKSDFQRSTSLTLYKEHYHNLLMNAARSRLITEAIVFQVQGSSRHIIARTNFSMALQLQLEDLESFNDKITRTQDGPVVIHSTESQDRLLAIVKLDNFFIDTYLMIGRFIDSTVLEHMRHTEAVVGEYQIQKTHISRQQTQFTIVFTLVALLLVLSTTWVGMVFASYIIRPIRSLVYATDRVKEGDLHARVDEESRYDDELGILTRAFNRMTKQLERQRKELIVAQRHAAWEDVARRIAHEIKNPLTPIHLAAERLKRKYAADSEHPETFTKYTDTIIRHADDIGKIIEEFIAFARMPAPMMVATDMNALLKEAVFSQECIHTDIQYHTALPATAPHIMCDPGQIHQVITNICKNAAEALEGQSTKSITVSIDSAEEKYITITIEDNGKGFPEELLERLTEPYITTREKGTGLGLAIVKRIIEDHNGTLEMYNTPCGACVTIRLPHITNPKENITDV